MSDVTRYGIEARDPGWCKTNWAVVESDDGHLVRHEDYERIKAERDRLAAELEAVRAALRCCAGLAHDLNGCAVGGSVDAIVEQLLVTIDEVERLTAERAPARADAEK